MNFKKLIEQIVDERIEIYFAGLTAAKTVFKKAKRVGRPPGSKNKKKKTELGKTE